MSLYEPDPQPVGLREQKKRQTKLELCRSARRLVLERGLDATTVDDIARAAGVSSRTFFNYYETKLDAIVGPVSEIGTEQARAVFIGGGPTGALVEDLAHLFAAGYEPESQLREDISVIKKIIDAEPRVIAGFMAFGARHESAVTDLLSARVGPDLTPEFASLTAVLMLMLTMRAALSMGGDPNRSLADALHDYCAMAARLFAPAEDGRRE